MFDLSQLSTAINSINVDSTSILEQEVNDNLLDWYTARLRQALEDECPAAAQAYVQHAVSNDKCNTLTCSMIILEFNKLQKLYLTEEGTNNEN